MLPYVGLYLPDSLHRKLDNKHKLAEWPNPSLSEKNTMERNSFDVRSTTGNDLRTEVNESSPVSTVFNFVDFLSSRKDVSSENAAFINLVQRVRQDEEEAQRLHASQAVMDFYESWPDRRTMNHRILTDIRCALNDIGDYIAGGRRPGDKSGAVGGLKQRFEWILRHHQKLLSRQTTLAVCHQSLIPVINLLQMVEMNSVYGSQTQIFEAPATPWMPRDETDILRSPYSRQKWRHSQRNLSLPSITVSEHEEKTSIRSTHSFPAELPGSTPDDLIDHENWDLYSSPVLFPSQTYIENDVEPPPIATPVREESKTDYVRNTRRSLDQPPPSRYQRSSLDHLPPSGRLRSSSELAPSPLRHWSSSDQIVPASSPERLPDHVNGNIASFEQVVTLSTPKETTDCEDDSTISAMHTYRTEFTATSQISLDQSSGLPTVHEKHTNQGKSPYQDGDVGKMPLLAKRYRPMPVMVRKPATRHRSLPSQLPYLPHQPSLSSELSHWVLSGTELNTPACIHLDASSTSATSSPIIPDTPASCPPATPYTSPVVVVGRHIPVSAPSSSPTQHVRPPVISLHDNGDPSMKGEFYRPAIGVQEVGSKFVGSLSAIETEETSHENELQSGATKSRPKASVNSSRNPSSDAIVRDDQPATPSLNIITAHESAATENFEDQKGASQITVSPLVRQQPTSLPSTEVDPISPTISLEPVKLNAAKTIPAQPLSSQAKRRIAHARRMQNVYGSN